VSACKPANTIRSLSDGLNFRRPCPVRARSIRLVHGTPPRACYKAQEDQTFTSGPVAFGAKHYKSVNGKLPKELLEREIFDTLLEAKDLIERWRQEYNTIRPHSSLGYLGPQHWKRLSRGLQFLPRSSCRARLRDRSSKL